MHWFSHIVFLWHAEKHGTCSYPVARDEYSYFLTTLNVYFKYNVTVSFGMMLAFYISSKINRSDLAASSLVPHWFAIVDFFFSSSYLINVTDDFPLHISFTFLRLIYNLSFLECLSCGSCYFMVNGLLDCRE